MRRLLLTGAVFLFVTAGLNAQQKVVKQNNNLKIQKSTNQINPTFQNLNLSSPAKVVLSADRSSMKHYCGSDEAMHEAINFIPGVKERIEQYKQEAALRRTLPDFQTPFVNFTLDTIPIVFHILYETSAENISNQVIFDAVAQLNRDYSFSDPDTTDIDPYFKPRAGATNLVFALATKDPSGAVTNGIIRHQTALTTWDRTAATNYGQNNYIYTGTTAGKWDPRKYLNIYIVKDIYTGSTGGGIVVGYTYTPGTWSSGYKADAIVYNNGFLGVVNKDVRSLAHEIGHWLGLPHTFNDPANPNSAGTTCGDDDLVNLMYRISAVDDTPKTMGFFSTCPSFPDANTCDVERSNMQNIMDYSSCPKMFTLGQSTIMREVLTQNYSGRMNLVTSANKIATGIRYPQVAIPSANFRADKRITCTGTIVNFSDSTENAIVSNYQWDFPGGNPANSIEANPQVTYASPGVYAVSYTATNSAGSNSISKTSFMTVGSNTAVAQTPLVEGFEFITFPNADWRTENTGGGITWVQDNTVGATGTNCIKLNNFSNTSSQEEIFYTPSYNISGINAVNPGSSFTFKLAYQRKTTAAAEKLQVYSSTNCGQTWNLRYSKSGATLATISAANTSAFVPTSATDWRTETVSISALMAQTNVWFKFVFTSDAGSAKNNIYIDNINLSNSVVGIKDIDDNSLFFNVYPNPNQGEMNVGFNLSENRNVKLELIDLLGKTIETAVNSKLNAGDYTFKFGSSIKLSSGIYFSKLTIDGKIYTQKVIVE